MSIYTMISSDLPRVDLPARFISKMVYIFKNRREVFLSRENVIELSLFIYVSIGTQGLGATYSM